MENTVRPTNDPIRTAAIRQGLEFIYQNARIEENFELYGYDYLACFQCIASTSKDVDLRRLASNMGKERSGHWRREHATVPLDADGNDIACLVMGSDAADRFGLVDPGFKEQLRKLAASLTVCDFLDFDPEIEPPPGDVPDACECGADNKRGYKRCRKCRKSLAMFSPYAVWLDALIYSYTGERSGIKLGAPYAEVIKWLPAMRNYREYSDDDDDYYWSIYAVTHVIYTLNDYGSYKLDPQWLPKEFAFLKHNLEAAIASNDPESLGEFLDTLKSFGLTEDDPLIATGVDYLLDNQNSDGSWGDPHAEDVYQRYHPTWTAIDGLRDYAWRGQRLSFPNLQSLLIANSEESK